MDEQTLRTSIRALMASGLPSAPHVIGNSPESSALLRRWGRLHAVRTAVSLVAFLIFVFLLAR